MKGRDFLSFPTQYRFGSRFYANSGTGVELDFSLSVNEDGEEYFELIGETDVYQRIQSYRDIVELSSLLDKFAKSEIDPFTLSQRLNAKEGVYMDTIGMPRTYAELFQRAKEAESSFAQLPKDVKEAFGNSHIVFWSKVGTPEFNSVYEKYMNAVSGSLDTGGVADEQKSE